MSLKDTQSSVALFNESGGTYSFVLQGGSYVSPAGLNVTLTKDGSGYTLRDRHGIAWRFATGGQLASITDPNGNAVQLAYAGNRLQTVTDSLGRSVTFTYDGQNHITAVQDFSGRQLKYSYDASVI